MDFVRQSGNCGDAAAAGVSVAAPTLVSPASPPPPSLQYSPSRESHSCRPYTSLFRLVGRVYAVMVGEEGVEQNYIAQQNTIEWAGGIE